MRPHNARTFTIGFMMVTLALAGFATPVEAGKKDNAGKGAGRSQPAAQKQQAQKQQAQKHNSSAKADNARRQTNIVTRRDPDANRVVRLERREVERKNGPDRNVFQRNVTRRDPDANRRVELQRTIDRRDDRPTRNVLDKTVSRTARVGDGRLRTVTLNKTTTTLAGQRTGVDFDRKVVVRPAPKPIRPIIYAHGHSHHVCDSGCRFYRPVVRSYPHGHAGHVCGSGCHFYRPVIRSYPHGHASHVCHSGCSHYRSAFSISFGYHGSHGSAHISYSKPYGYSPCHLCGGGYYKRIYVPGRCITYYDPCGRPYTRYVGGYYKTVRIAHSC